MKRNVLEVERLPSALADSDAFTELETRIDELGAELDDLEAAFDGRLGYH